MKNTLFKLILRKAIIIFLIGIIFAFVSVQLSAVFSPKFKTDLFAYTTLFENTHNKSSFKSINSLLDEKKHDVLAQKMNISEDVVRDIKKIDFFDLPSKNKNFFKLTITCYSNNYFVEIADGINYFYQNEKENKKILQAEQIRLQRLIDFKEAEIEKIEQQLAKENEFSYESDLFIGKNVLNNELERTRLDLLYKKELNYINEVVSPSNPYFPNFTYFALFGFIFGVLLSSFILLIQFEFKKNKNA